MPDHVLNLSDLINPTARQREFMAAVVAHKYTLYGGAAGGGKSYILRWTLIYLLLRWAAQGLKGVRVGLFCEDYPTLQDRQISKIKTEFPSWLGQLRENRDEGFAFFLKPEFGGGAILLRNLDKPEKYQSSEFAAIAVEELTKNELDVFDLLRFRLRWTGIEETKFLAATNPGGIGHSWCKRLWISKDFPKELQPAAHQFAFVKALVSDNPHVAASYVETLQSLPAHLRVPMLEGSWDIFAGQVFDEWRADEHTCEPFEIPSHWRRWGANDPGYKDPSVWLWFAVSEDGVVYVYREVSLYGTDAYDQAKQIAGQNGKDDLDWWVTGLDAFAVQHATGKATVDLYVAGGLNGFVKPVRTGDIRAERAKTVHHYLKGRLKIFTTCRKLIETLPGLPADKNNSEHVKECAEDHWYDALGYGLQKWHVERSSKVPHKYDPGTYGAVSEIAKVFGPKPVKPGAFARE